MIPEVYWSIVNFLLGNALDALGDQISDAWFPPFLVSDVSDIPGDPGSQLPYQEFPLYYLAPI